MSPHLILTTGKASYSNVACFFVLGKLKQSRFNPLEFEGVKEVKFNTVFKLVEFDQFKVRYS